MSFSEKIVERRVSLNMSQKELAERLGVTPTRLNYWEKGKREPDVHYIKALARELGVSGDYLLETESEEGTSGSVTGIGERIKKARLEKGYTQLQLAEMIGVAKNTITGYETGTREPDSNRITAIAKALSVSGDYILGTEYDWLPSAEAMKIAHKFDKLDSHGQGLVKTIVDYELGRVMPQETQGQSQEDKKDTAWATSKVNPEMGIDESEGNVQAQHK